MKVTILGKDYVFVNSTHSTRNGFAHETQLVDANTGDVMCGARVNYLNRTWERYTYETVMRSCLSQWRTAHLDGRIERYRKEHNITKFKPNQRQALVGELVKDPLITDIDKAMEAL